VEFIMTFRNSIRLLGLSGSTRSASLNSRLLTLAREKLPACVALEATSVGDFGLPLYDQDQEPDMPPGAIVLADRIAGSDGLIVASPEHNGSVSAALKSALDWISRLPGGRKPLEGKPVLLMSASPGRIGGRRGLVHLRDILGGLGARVCDGEVTVPNAEVSLGEAERALAHPIRGEIAFVIDRFIPTFAVHTADPILDVAGGTA
jgi:NAD(P)H-dependent FMN reductase